MPFVRVRVRVYVHIRTYRLRYIFLFPENEIILGYKEEQMAV